jgi:hypothetical protein
MNSFSFRSIGLIDDAREKIAPHIEPFHRDLESGDGELDASHFESPRLISWKTTMSLSGTAYFAHEGASV